MNSFLTTTVDNHLLLKKSAIRPLANTAIANATYGIPENMPFWIRSYERVYLWTLNKLISDWSHTSIMAINCQLICFIHLSVCPYLFVHPSIRPSVRPYIHPTIHHSPLQALIRLLFLTFPKESPKASLKYDGIHVSRVYPPQLLQKCAIIIAHTAGDVIICNHGVGSCVNNYYAIENHVCKDVIRNHCVRSCENSNLYPPFSLFTQSSIESDASSCYWCYYINFKISHILCPHFLPV